MKTLMLLFVPVFLLLLAAPALAVPPQWHFDPPHCQIIFTIKHIFAPVSGQFDKFEGEVFFSPEDPAHGKVSLTIPVESIDTRVPARDAHLKTPDFFDLAKYPQIRFVSQSITKQGKDQFAVKGQLTMKDVTKPVTIVFTYLGSKVNPMDPQKLVMGFQGGFSLNRLDYHVGSGKFYDMGVVGNQVDIALHLELVRDK